MRVKRVNKLLDEERRRREICVGKEYNDVDNVKEEISVATNKEVRMVTKRRRNKLKRSGKKGETLSLIHI